MNTPCNFWNANPASPASIHTSVLVCLMTNIDCLHSAIATMLSAFVVADEKLRAFHVDRSLRFDWYKLLVPSEFTRPKPSWYVAFTGPAAGSEIVESTPEATRYPLTPSKNASCVVLLINETGPMEVPMLPIVVGENAVLTE